MSKEKSEMNYITEINAFNKWLETNYLPPLAQLLWYKLMHRFNMSRWDEWITVKNEQLMLDLDISLSSEKTFRTNRDLLLQHGFIDYKKGKKGTPPKFKLFSVVGILSGLKPVNNTENVTSNTTENITENVTNNNCGDADEHKDTDSLKHKRKHKHKLDNNKYIVEIIDYLNESLGTKYKANTAETVRLVTARLNNGFTVDDFKSVIDIKKCQWIDDTKMKAYLRPSTLFGTKFESYLNESNIEKPKSEVGEFNIGQSV